MFITNHSRVVAKNLPNLKNAFLPLLPLSQFNFTSNFLSLFTPLAQGDEKWGCSQLIIVSGPPFLSGEVLLTLFPCSITGSFPWQTGLHEFLQFESFSQAAVLHKLGNTHHGVTSRASKPAPVRAPLSAGLWKEPKLACHFFLV